MNEISTHIHKLSSASDAQMAYCCMTEVPTPWPEALCHCRDWISQNLGVHVEGYHLQLASGEVIGHIYYSLSQRALFPYQVEPDVCVLYCEWIQRQYHGLGFGKSLSNVFLSDMQQESIKGVLVEGTDFEGQMNYQHYLARDFKIVSEKEHRKLLYLPLNQPRVEVKPLARRIQPRRGVPVEIVVINGYLCPYEVSSQLILRQVVQEFGDRVNLQEVSLTPETLHDYGDARGTFVNGKQKLLGGESEEEIRQAILEEI